MKFGGAYYNEIDPFAAQWLRNLIAAGHIAPGDVDERSIVDVRASDLAGYTQCHFFAGIGGWSLALRLAGWPDGRPVWTGSCPCQGFSAAGNGAGFDDARHLWPDWFRLVRERRPGVVFGEQVASPLALAWLDLVQADMEGEGYAFAALDICAAGVGAPHIRQRLRFVADAHDAGFSQRGSDGRIQQEALGAPEGQAAFSGSDVGRLTDADGRNSETERLQRGGEYGLGPQDGGALPSGGSRASDSPWENPDWLLCRDGKWRPVEPGTFPLAHGISGRVGRLRAYGNAIVPQDQAEFIAAYLECVSA